MTKKNAITPDVTVRPARPSEASKISLLYFEWLKSGEERGRINEIRKAIRGRQVLVTFDRKSNEIIGFIHGIIQNDPISSGPLLYISALYVRPQFRRSGIGSRLLNSMIRMAEIRGAVAVEVATAQKPAFLLYKKFGFSQYRADMGEVLLGLNLKKFKEKRRELNSWTDE